MSFWVIKSGEDSRYFSCLHVYLDFVYQYGSTKEINVVLLGLPFSLLISRTGVPSQ